MLLLLLKSCFLIALYLFYSALETFMFHFLIKYFARLLVQTGGLEL